jgi:hypothetical protein
MPPELDAEAVDFVAADVAANLVVPEAVSLDFSSADAATGQRKASARTVLSRRLGGDKSFHKIEIDF